MTHTDLAAAPPVHLIDMDGVLVSGSVPIEKSADYIQLLTDAHVPFQVFSNNSRFTPGEMASRLRKAGFQISDDDVYTSALTTAQLIAQQKPGARCFVIGEEGLVRALEDVGIVLDDTAPDYVVVGESIDYSFSDMAKGARLITAGARFIGTNPDKTIPIDDGINPACGAACALIETATGVRPYFIGKPNPFMMRAALDRMGVHAADAIMIGDRLDTDVIAGMELGLRTGLVLTGTSRRADLENYPYGPDYIVERLHDFADVFGIS